MLTFLMPRSLGVLRAEVRADMLRQRLTTELGEPVVVEIAAEYGDMAGIAAAGAAHLVWAPAVVVAGLSSPRAIFKARRGDRSTYRAVLVSRSDRHLTLEDLRGARAAWVDRESLGGYRLVVHALRKRGIDPHAVLSDEQFVGSYPAVVDAIREGRADFGALYVPSDEPAIIESALEEHRGAGGRHKLEALLVSDPVPTDAFVILDTVPEARARVIATKLFPLATNGHGIAPGRPASLCLALGVDGFERADPSEYATVRELFTA